MPEDPPPGHSGEIDISHNATGVVYVATCECGWDGDGCDDNETALADLERHYKEEKGVID